jgi:mono/diheme cytochrome c family protein
MRFPQKNIIINIAFVIVVGSVLTTLVYAQSSKKIEQGPMAAEDTVSTNAAALIQDGRNIFRYDTYGDETFWGDALQLHQAIQGSQFGGVGPGVSPKTALALGLKVDADALPAQVLAKLRQGQINLDDVSVTLTLLKNDAVVGVKGFFNTDGSLKSVGLTCAVCHSTVNDSVAPGVGRRLDGWANHDLNTGAVIAAAPNLTPIRNLLQIVHPTITDETIRVVLNSWGPGKFDAQLLFDGKAFGPSNAVAATLIPNAFGLLGHNLHTWTGGWGTVTYWNALVAVLEMGGKGTFFDPRLDDTNHWPIAATARFGHTSVANPDEDQVTPKLPALHYYQLSLPAPRSTPGVDFDQAVAERGRALFNGKANCVSCHRSPIWTDPGRNDHTPAEMKIDPFQADRSPAGTYRTMNLAGLYIRERGLFMKPENKGRFYHDGRFQTLLDVVNSYNSRFELGLAPQESQDLVEYLKSL